MNASVAYKARGCLVGGAITSARDERDDIRSTGAICESVVRCHGFNTVDCVRATAMAGHPHGENTPLGMTLQGLRLWFESDGERGVSPTAHANNLFLGPAVAAHVAPLGVFAGLRPEDLSLDWIYDLGRATHGDLRASAAAYFIATFIRSLVQEPHRLEAKEFVALAREAIEATARSEDGRREQLTREGRGYLLPTPALHQRLTMVTDLFDAGPASPLRAETLDPLYRHFGSALSSALTAVPLALGIAIRNATEFHDAVAEARQLKHPSITKLVGELVGANVGLTEISVGVIADAPHGHQFQALSDQLIAAAA